MTMPRSMAVRAILALLLVIPGAGCTTHLADLGLVSNRSVGATLEPVARGVEGSSCAYHALGLIPVRGGVAPDVELAMLEALDKAPEGNVLTNVALYSDFLYTIAYSKSCIRVKADVRSIR